MSTTLTLTHDEIRTLIAACHVVEEWKSGVWPDEGIDETLRIAEHLSRRLPKD